MQHIVYVTLTINLMLSLTSGIPNTITNSKTFDLLNGDQQE